MIKLIIYPFFSRSQIFPLPLFHKPVPLSCHSLFRRCPRPPPSPPFFSFFFFPPLAYLGAFISLKVLLFTHPALRSFPRSFFSFFLSLFLSPLPFLLCLVLFDLFSPFLFRPHLSFAFPNLPKSNTFPTSLATSTESSGPFPPSPFCLEIFIPDSVELLFAR